MENFSKKFLIIFGCTVVFFILAFGFIIFFDYNELTFAKKMIIALHRNVIVWIIIIQFLVGCFFLIEIFKNTLKESQLLSKMISNKSSEIVQGKIDNRLTQTFLGKHIQKISSAEYFHWNTEAKNNLNNYLESQLFFYPNLLEMMSSLLPAWGMLGTVVGLAQALETKAQGGQLYLGVAIALGTTILGLIANLILYSLINIIKEERKLQLKTINVLISQGEDKNES